jgi:hypothetical protein
MRWESQWRSSSRITRASGAGILVTATFTWTSVVGAWDARLNYWRHPKEDDMLLLLTGVVAGMMLMVLLSQIFANRRIRKLVDEHKIINARYEAAVAEFEGLVVRASRMYNDGKDKGQLS